MSETDQFWRLLWYVYLESGEMVNEVLVREGFALTSTFPPDVKYTQRFLAAQDQARTANRGLWGGVSGAGGTSGHSKTAVGHSVGESSYAG